MGNLLETSMLQQARPVARLLSRLSSVRQRGPARWAARCPAHEDRRPSLSIRETPDGKVLVRCWAGCSTEQVLAAAGLNWADLFPSNERRRPQTPEKHREAEEAAYLAFQLDRAFEVAYRRLARIYRAARNLLVERNLAVPRWALPTIHRLPWIEHCLDQLSTGTLDEKLSALEEAEQWLS